jgi:hypothetical protein
LLCAKPTPYRPEETLPALDIALTATRQRSKEDEMRH